MTSEKFLRNIFRPVSQQRNAKKIFLLRKIDGVVEQLRSVAFRLVFFVDDQVLEQHDKAALGSTDGEEQIDLCLSGLKSLSWANNSTSIADNSSKSASVAGSITMFSCSLIARPRLFQKSVVLAIL